MAVIQGQEFQKLWQEVQNALSGAKATADPTAELVGDIESTLNEISKKIPKDQAGQIQPKVWDDQPEADRISQYKEVLRLKYALDGVAEADGPTDPDSIMSKAYVSDRGVRQLVGTGILMMLLVLLLIYLAWPAATKGMPAQTKTSRPAEPPAPVPPEPKANPVGQTKSGSTGETKTEAPGDAKRGTGAEGTKAASERDKAPEDGKKEVPGGAKTSPPGTKDTGTATKGENEGNKDGPAEDTLLYMVILMGMLGGLLHFTGSLAKFVGNRQLRRSWVVYYLLMPFEGASVALLVYLVLRVGIFSPTTETTGTAALNPIKIYAFTGMAGLFSKQALEMLSEVFGTIFKRVQAKDAAEKPKSDGAAGTASKVTPAPK